MKRKTYSKLLGSVREAGRILRGERSPSRRFVVSAGWHAMSDEPLGSGYKIVTLQEKTQGGRIAFPIYFYAFTDGRGKWEFDDDDFLMVSWMDVPKPMATTDPEQPLTQDEIEKAE